MHRVTYMKANSTMALCSDMVSIHTLMVATTKGNSGNYVFDVVSFVWFLR